AWGSGFRRAAGRAPACAAPAATLDRRSASAAPAGSEEFRPVRSAAAADACRRRAPAAAPAPVYGRASSWVAEFFFHGCSEGLRRATECFPGIRVQAAQAPGDIGGVERGGLEPAAHLIPLQRRRDRRALARAYRVGGHGGGPGTVAQIVDEDEPGALLLGR